MTVRFRFPRGVPVRRQQPPAVRWLGVVGLIWLLGPAAWAAIDAYTFSNDEHARRYRVLVDELRCPVCLSSSLSGSDSPISADLRREVYRLIEDGKSDDEIRDYMHARYGDYILYRPRLTPFTVALYAVPLVLLAAGALLVLRIVRARRRLATPVAVDTGAIDVLLAKHAPVADRQGDPAAPGPRSS